MAVAQLGWGLAGMAIVLIMADRHEGSMWINRRRPWVGAGK